MRVNPFPWNASDLVVRDTYSSTDSILPELLHGDSVGVGTCRSFGRHSDDAVTFNRSITDGITGNTRIRHFRNLVITDIESIYISKVDSNSTISCKCAAGDGNIFKRAGIRVR